MSTVAMALVAFVAAQHAAFFVLESFLWTSPAGRKVFRTTAEFAAASRALAANQGLYNSFLAAGLVWAIWLRSPDIATFFLACVVVAGVVGAATVHLRILFVQAVPAAVALAVVHLPRVA
jgi:putative membrane protein